MPLTLPCETYVRLARLAQVVGSKQYSWLRSVALQRKNRRLFALATNAYFCAVEYLGEQPGEPDDFILIKIDPVLLAQCELEKPFGSLITLTKNDILNYVEFRTTFGFVYDGNAGVFPLEAVPLKDWQDWVKPFPKVATGGVFANVDQLSALVSTSPSGKVLFPRAIDVNEPIAIADAIASNWLGFFVPWDSDGRKYDFADFPEWAKP